MYTYMHMACYICKYQHTWTEHEITAGQMTFSGEIQCLSGQILICMEEISGLGFSELKPEATENC